MKKFNREMLKQLAYQKYGSMEVRINLGSGEISDKNRLTIDCIKNGNVDIESTIEGYLKNCETGIVMEWYSRHAFEHLKNPIDVINSIVKASTPNSQMTIIVPHFRNPYFYSDPTHRNWFGLYSMSYIAKNANAFFIRSTPAYAQNDELTIESVKLGFRLVEYAPTANTIWTVMPVYAVVIANKLYTSIMNSIVNSCTPMQEMYEWFLSQLLPCYEISYVLKIRRETTENGS